MNYEIGAELISNSKVSLQVLLFEDVIMTKVLRFFPDGIRYYSLIFSNSGNGWVGCNIRVYNGRMNPNTKNKKCRLKKSTSVIADFLSCAVVF